MRKLLVWSVMVAMMSFAAAGVAGGDRTARRDTLPAGLSIHVSAGWRVLRGWLSNVSDPSPRLAVATFPVRLSRRTCVCGFPNVVSFPREGAFVFVWEYLHVSRRGLARVPVRPAHVHLAAGGSVRHTCAGASAMLSFRDAGRVFQVEVYLGPGAGPRLRRQAATLLDSLRVAPAT